MKGILLIVFIFFANLLNGQKIIANKGYISNQVQTVVITPYFDEQGKVVESINGVFMQVFSIAYDMGDQQEIIHNISNDYEFNELLVKHIYINFASAVQTIPNVFATLTDNELLEIKKGFLNSDLLVVTSPIYSKRVVKVNNSGNIRLTGNITVFDLTTGEFVAHISSKVKKKFMNMLEAEEPFEKLVTSLRAGLAKTLEN